MRTKIKLKRGYILMEVMIAGMLAAVVLAGALTYMAAARSQTIKAARQQSASSFVQQSVERFMILPIANLNAASFPATETVTLPGGGSFTRTHAIAVGSQTFSGTAVPTHTLSVAVEFNAGGKVVTNATTVRFE